MMLDMQTTDPARSQVRGEGVRWRDSWLALLVGMLLGQTVWAAPFSREVRFTQPGGATIRLWGEGDEFRAVFETLDGYTVIFVPERRAYYYAQPSPDGAGLAASTLMVGRDRPTDAISPHLRPNPVEARRAALKRRAARDRALGIERRWAELRSAHLHPTRMARQSPPRQTTTGVQCGLTVLVDFEDEPGTLPREEVLNFLNGDNYRAYGNFGSLKQYYWDNSNGKLLYTNVVTAYVRIPNSLHPRSYYDDVSRSCEASANLLIRDAVNVLTNLPNFASEIKPALAAATVDEQGRVRAANFFFAGDNSGVWGYGLWPNMGLLDAVGPRELWPGGPRIDLYQITNMGDRLEVATFAHENGHMLCGFPDIYDYDQDSVGGAGLFCLMSTAPSYTHPQQFCAYLKLAAGWATVSDLRPGSSETIRLAASGEGYNRFYRYVKPFAFTDIISDTEYYLIENRQREGWDQLLPATGLAIWHIDELGSFNDRSLDPNTEHANYEVTLVQADARWDFERNRSWGDANDLYYQGNPAAGYVNRLSDETEPAALWWNGSRSGLNLGEITASSTVMEARVRGGPARHRHRPSEHRGQHRAGRVLIRGARHERPLAV